MEPEERAEFSSCNDFPVFHVIIIPVLAPDIDQILLEKNTHMLNKQISKFYIFSLIELFNFYT